MVKESHANSAREGSRWRHERYQLRSKKVSSSHGVRDSPERTPPSNSSVMVNPKKRDSTSSYSGGSYKSHRRAGVEAPSKLQKINETSKVRFLTAEEVIKRALCTEAPRSGHVGSPISRDCLTPSRSSQIAGRTPSSKSSVSAKTETQRAHDGRQNSLSNQHLHIQSSESTENEEAPPGFHIKNSTVGGKPICTGTENNHDKKVSSDGKSERDSSLVFPGAGCASGPNRALEDVAPRNTEHDPTGFPSKNSTVGGEPICTGTENNPGKQVSSDGKGERDSSFMFPGASSVSALDCALEDVPPRNTEHGVKFEAGPPSNCDDGQEGNLLGNLPYSPDCPQNGPALKSVWKGKFEVLDIESDVRRCEGFLAHPSAKVSRRAYELSRSITEVLQFVMHPRSDFWPEIFQTDCPDRNDIALYFYPGHYERSKRQYSFLLKLMEKQDLVLRSRIGNIQLFVFPSKLLHPDSQKLDGSYFMWGVFCSTKCSKATLKEDSHPSSSHIVA